MPRVDDPKRKCCLIAPLSKCKAIRDCNVVIEVVIDDCSDAVSTALLAVSVRKLNADIFSILPIHFMGRFAFFNTIARGDKRPSWNARALLVQFVACREKRFQPFREFPLSI